MTIREARPEDAPDMARVRVDTWKAAYRGIVPDDYLDNLSYAAVERLWQIVLWEDNQGSFAYVSENADGRIVGIAIAGPVLEEEEAEYKGEIYVLYVLPDCQNQGLGRMLFQACAQRLRQLNLTPVMLWTFAQNPSRTFYDNLNGVVVRKKQVETGGKLLDEVGYGWTDVDLPGK